MAIRIVEIHPATTPGALNTEWFVVTNDGERPFSTRTCTLAVSRKGSKKRRELGTIDPGFTLLPGATMRVLTGNPARKVHGAPPTEGPSNYSLFLNEPIFVEPGMTLSIVLRTMVVTSAVWDPDAPNGVGGTAAS